jgi:hypothetical protein
VIINPDVAGRITTQRKTTNTAANLNKNIVILEMWQKVHKVSLQKNKTPCKSQELYQSPVGRKLTRDSTKHVESCLKELVSQETVANLSAAAQPHLRDMKTFTNGCNHMSSSLFNDLQEIVVVHFDVERRRRRSEVQALTDPCKFLPRKQFYCQEYNCSREALGVKDPESLIIIMMSSPTFLTSR